MIWLIGAFAATALLYASVGFGGGSTYTALLALSGIDYRILPAISLACNVVVVAGGTIRFACAGLLDWKAALPLALLAAPFAWLGGQTPISERAFLTLLALSLMLAGLALLLQRDGNASEDTNAGNALLRRLTLPFSAGVGYLAGLVGIGGGIFLAPFLHLTRWGKAKQIAATASLFILVNSLSGLAGQAQKLATNGQFPELLAHWPLMLAVLLGGSVGTHLGITVLRAQPIRMLTGLLTLFVAGQLLWKLYGR